MGPHPLRSRHWTTIRLWLAFLLLCLILAGLQRLIAAAGVRWSKIEADQDATVADLEHLLSMAPENELLAAINQNDPGSIDSGANRVQPVIFDSGQLSPKFAGYKVHMEFNPWLDIHLHFQIVRPKPLDHPILDWLGSRSMQVSAERGRQCLMSICAALWFGIAMLIPAAGIYRRRLAQIMVASATLAFLCWMADPSVHGIPSAIAGAWVPLLAIAGFIVSIIAIVLPSRHARSAKGQCPACNYDLTGNVSGRCPECGEPTPAELRRQRDAELAVYAAAFERITTSSEPQSI